MAGKRNRRLARANAMNEVEQKALAAGLTEEDARAARRDVHKVMTEKMQPSALRVLKKNVAEFGAAGGAILGAVGAAVGTIAPIGTVIGAAAAAAGAGLAAAGKKQAADLARIKAAKERSMALTELIASGGVKPPDQLDPLGLKPEEPSPVTVMCKAREKGSPKSEAAREAQESAGSAANTTSPQQATKKGFFETLFESLGSILAGRKKP